MSRVSAPHVWGFWVVSSCFVFEPRCLPLFPLRASCDVGVPCMPSSSLLSVGFLVALSVFCVQCSFFLLFRFPGYLTRPASVSPRRRFLFLSPRAPFRSLSRPFFAFPRGVFSYTAFSSSSVPWRRGLLVCLHLRLRRRLRVLLTCPLFWLLPPRLPSGFHLLLSFCCAVLLLTWFRWGPVVPTRVVV